MTSAAPAPGGDRVFAAFCAAGLWPGLGRRTAAEGLGTTPLAVALAWVRDRPGVVAPIVGARTAQQLQASLDADGVRLPAAIRTALEDVSAPPFSYPERRSEG